MNAVIDHLVIAAASLEQGAAWCVSTFGVQPSGGGKHPLMGTHNRVIAVSSESFPDCYLEVIAIDPDAHAAVRTLKIEVLRRDLAKVVLNPGELLTAQRHTAHGVLKWRITVRDDGRVECASALPSLIARCPA